MQSKYDNKSLPELIEMCGESFGQLHKCRGNEYNKMEDHWIVYPTENPPHISQKLIDDMCDKNNNKYPCTGSTPEESIIRFLLELDKLKDKQYE